jgi:hypothetical protein
MSKISELSDGGVIQGGDTLIAVRSGGNVKVTYGGTTTANIDGGTIDGTVIGGTTPAAGSFTTGSFTGDVSFGDNDKAIFGAGSDLKIYHDGSDSYIDDTGTGRLRLRGAADIILAHPTNGEIYATFSANGANTFYYDNAAKLATTSTGIDVTGTVTADGVSSDGNISMSGAGTGSRYVLLGNETSAYAGSLVMQAGGGSAAYGGSIIAYGHSHASKAGDIVAGISSGSGGAFRVNTSGIDSGGDVLVVEASGNVGIGTSSPSGPLNVHSASGDTNLYVTTGNTAASTNIFFGDSGNSTIGRIVYDHNGDYMKFRTNGSDAMRIDSSSNLLVGKTSLDVGVVGQELRSSGFMAATRDGSTVGAYTRLNSDGTILEFRKDSSAVGSIGVSTGTAYIQGNSASSGFLFGNSNIYPWDAGAINDAGIDLGGSSNRFKDLYLSGSMFANKARIGTTTTLFSSGEFASINGSTSIALGLVNTSSSNGTLYIKNLHGDGTSNSRTLVFFQANSGNRGSITSNGSSVSYNTTSDYRLKENVVPLTGATERVKQLNPSRFNFIADADTTVDGFLAHEVADVVPEAITGTKDAMRDEEYEVTPAVYEDVIIPAVLDEEGNEVEAERTEQQLVTEAVMGTRSVPDYQGIDQSKLVPLLVATIQELEARITALETN